MFLHMIKKVTQEKTAFSVRLLCNRKELLRH